MDAHEKGFFTEENSVEVVTGRNQNAKDERLKQVMEVITRKLHEAVKEIEPTEKEWFEAIMFLTKTGQLCTDWRQEYILLSDVTGVSMLVDAINNRKPSGASESTVLGPFHVAAAPVREMGDNICLDRKGEDMFDMAAFWIPKASLSAARSSMSGRPMTRASTMSSKRASSRISTCAACSGPARMAATGSAP